jgi:hypothetical protein
MISLVMRSSSSPALRIAAMCHSQHAAHYQNPAAEIKKDYAFTSAFSAASTVKPVEISR